ncbi:MAG: MBL fold metallo-hydrolase [Pseudomonadota bacterium]
MSSGKITVRFWGTRGAVASSEPECTHFGGNTSCVEMLCDDHVLIFDAGTGIRRLGESLLKRGISKYHLFFTHCHYDHISGFPFFKPLYMPTTDIDIWSGHLKPPKCTRSMIADFMVQPFFPIGPEVLQAKVAYMDFRPGDTIDSLKNVTIKTTLLNHDQGAVAYRVEFNGKAVCYVTDTTHVIGAPDQNIVNLIRGSDLVIYDATYTDDEFDTYKDYGHSTWQEGIRLCQAAEVDTMALFHHCPGRSDEQLKEIERQAQALLPKAFAAYEDGEVVV